MVCVCGEVLMKLQMDPIHAIGLSNGTSTPIKYEMVVKG